MTNTMAMQNRQGVDPLARAAESPDVSALITEFEYAVQNGPAQLSGLAQAEDVRFNRWPGKSPERDGRLHQKNQPQGETVKPYNRRPDTDVNLCDEIVLTETDLDLTAFSMAQMSAKAVHLNPMSAAKIAELTAIGRYIRDAIEPDTQDGAELLSQIKNSAGWCVLRTYWRERWTLVERTITMDEVFGTANQAMAEWQKAVVRGQADPTAPPSITQLPTLIADPTLEDLAVETVVASAPHLRKAKARQIVRDLRETGEAQFLDRQQVEKRPAVEVLIPGINFFVSGGAKDLQHARGILRVEFFYQAELEAMAVEAGWNEDFIARAAGTAGQMSPHLSGLTGMNVNADSVDRRIEIWTTEVRQFDEDTGVTGIYCTTFSPHLNPGNRAGAVDKSWYAAHYLLDFAHGEFPYVVARREVIGPALDDSRGVAEMVQADQNQIKLHQDGLAIRAQWEVSPALIKVGPGWSKIKELPAPGAEISNLASGAELKAFTLDRGNPQVGAAFIREIEQGTRRRFALPNNGEDGGHPSLWQMRQSRNSRRWLACWQSAFWQLTVLCYQEFSPAELAQVIGRWPQLEVPDLLSHRLVLSFDARALDNDWRKETLATFLQLLTMDKGGQIDTAALIKIIGSMTDTTMMDSVLRSPQGAQAQLYRKVEQDVTSILLGNPPPLVEMDASAGMQKQMAFAVIGKNRMYQQMIATNPQAQENLKTYFQNLDHSEQETTISPVQGRLGVAEMPQKPVSHGNAMSQAET